MLTFHMPERLFTRTYAYFYVIGIFKVWITAAPRTRVTP